MLFVPTPPVKPGSPRRWVTRAPVLRPELGDLMRGAVQGLVDLAALGLGTGDIWLIYG